MYLFNVLFIYLFIHSFKLLPRQHYLTVLSIYLFVCLFVCFNYYQGNIYLKARSHQGR